MKRYASSVLAAAIAALVLSSPARAQQPFIFFGGGATLPVGEYADYAQTGWMLTGGLGFNLGSKGAMLGFEGYFGSNRHDDSPPNVKEKTNIFAGLATLGYQFGQSDAKVRPYILGGAGVLNHQFRSDDTQATETNEAKFAYTGAAGLGFRLNEKASFWVEGRFMGASDTNLGALLAGIAITLGGN